ncbi:MAG: ferric reductase-like transmembrane domain-containing protein [Phycisphaeraceae bacterium]|nr:ferric reductase-like transmembrane domain-containing protein [Phycisphaeraceae bacterium]
MSHRYRAVQWTRHKAVYDGVIAGACVAFVAVFIGIGMAVHRPPSEVSVPILLMRALGTLAIVLLHVVLAIGPLSRLWPRTTFLLANRRHLGVATFLVALLHAAVVLGFYGGFGVQNPVLAVLVRPDGSVGFEFPGFLALLVLFVLAATSHDIWLAFLGHALWKWVHMAAYGAYALVVAHVALGVLAGKPSIFLPALLLAGVLVLGGLHLAAGRRERHRDARGPSPHARAEDGWIDIGDPASIPDQRARVLCIGGGHRVAIFRVGDRLTALSNVCAHQGGPLGEGQVMDGCVTCPWHGYQYRPHDGQSPPPYSERVPTYELRVRGGRVQVCPTPNAPGTPTTPIAIPSPTSPRP